MSFMEYLAVSFILIAGGALTLYMCGYWEKKSWMK